jgi:hypothetical protein
MNEKDFLYNELNFLFILKRQQQQFILSSINKIQQIITLLRSFLFSSASQKFKLFQSTSKDLSNRFEFKNSWINDTKKWSYSQNQLCVRCDYINHIFKKCTNDSLLSWKQSYLKKIVFDQSTQINYLSTYDY